MLSGLQWGQSSLGSPNRPRCQERPHTELRNLGGCGELQLPTLPAMGAGLTWAGRHENKTGRESVIWVKSGKSTSGARKAFRGKR